MTLMRLSFSTVVVLTCVEVLPACQTQSKIAEQSTPVTHIPPAVVVSSVSSESKNVLSSDCKNADEPSVCASVIGSVSSVSPESKNVSSSSRNDSDCTSVTVPAEAFGKQAWEKYFGDVGEEPPLPKKLADIWSGNCPFWKDKQAAETHLLTLIPAQVDGVPFSLRHLLVGDKGQAGLITKLQYESHQVEHKCRANALQMLGCDDERQRQAENHGRWSLAPSSSYWVLMTCDAVPDTIGKSIPIMQARLQKGYVLPTTLEAITTILTHYANKGRYFFVESKIVCEEKESQRVKKSDSGDEYIVSSQIVVGYSSHVRSNNNYLEICARPVTSGLSFMTIPYTGAAALKR